MSSKPTSPRPLTEEDLLAAAQVIERQQANPPVQPGTPNAEQMTHARPGPSNAPGAALVVVPVQAKKPDPQPRVRQAPPEVVARKPAAGPAPETGPAPAAVAAERGVTGGPDPLANVPRGTPEPERVPPAYDKPAFQYQDRVDRGVAEAMRRGRPDIAAQIQGEYANLIVGQFRAMENQYEVDTLPQVHAIRKQLLDFQGQQLPAEFVAKARDVAMQAQAQQRRIMAFAYGLERNAMTAGSGVKLFNESKLIEPGVTLDRVEVHGGNLVGLDAQGKTVKFLNGSDFIVPVDQAEALYSQEFEGDKSNNTVIPEGSIMVNAQGDRLAANPKSTVGTPSEQLSATKAAADVIATEFGAKRDPVSNMIDPDTIKDRPGYTQALAEVERLVKSGVPPLEAANTVAQNYRRAATAPRGNAAAYDGPRPWSPKQ